MDGAVCSNESDVSLHRSSCRSHEQLLYSIWNGKNLKQPFGLFVKSGFVQIRVTIYRAIWEIVRCIWNTKLSPIWDKLNGAVFGAFTDRGKGKNTDFCSSVKGQQLCREAKQTGWSVFVAGSCLISVQPQGQPQRTHARHRGAVTHWLFFYFILFFCFFFVLLSLQPRHNKGILSSTLLQCASLKQVFFSSSTHPGSVLDPTL